MKDPRLFIICIIFGILTIPVRHCLYPNDSKGWIVSTYSSNPPDLYNSSPDCIKMFYSIQKYSNKYNVPIRYMFGIAYSESRYSGPLQWEYYPQHVSPAGALGPMQIMSNSAKGAWGEPISEERLLNDIDFNIETSAIILSRQYKKYGDWKLVFGAYNTGRPCINEYSEFLYNF